MIKFTYKAGNYVVVEEDRENLEPFWTGKVSKVITKDGDQCIQNLTVYRYRRKEEHKNKINVLLRQIYPCYQTSPSLQKGNIHKNSSIAFRAPQYLYTDTIDSDTILVTFESPARRYTLRLAVQKKLRS